MFTSTTQTHNTCSAHINTWHTTLVQIPTNIHASYFFKHQTWLKQILTNMYTQTNQKPSNDSHQHTRVHLHKHQRLATRPSPFVYVDADNEY